MNAKEKNQRAFIAELRNSEFPQITGAYYHLANSAYGEWFIMTAVCAVGCANVAEMKLKGEDVHKNAALSRGFGLEQAANFLNTDLDTIRRIIALNDIEEKSFSEIADVLEKEWEL